MTDSHNPNSSKKRVHTSELETQQRKREKWLADNADAIAEYNAYVDKHGVFSDGRRKF